MSWLRLMEESLKEKEAAPVAEPAQPPHGGRKPNRVMHLVKEMWPAYLIEIVVIILGIWITLGLEEWRDAGKERTLEQVYLKNLFTDVERDLHSLEQTSANTQKILDRGTAILTSVRNPEAGGVSIDQVRADVLVILSRPKFVSSDATFSDLKSSGNLHLLKDIRLKNLIFTYYNYTQDIRNAQDAEQQATINLSGSYFLKAFPLVDRIASGSASGSEFAKNVEFGNNVLLRVTTRRELLEMYQQADSSATQLKRALGEAIE